MNKISVAFIETGYIADYYVGSLFDQENVEIFAICCRREEKAKAFAEKYGVKKFSTYVNNIYTDNKTDAVNIATPNKYHALYAIECMKNGKDVFLEKSMAMNLEEGKQVIITVEETGRIVMVCHMWRFNKEVNFIKKVLESGRISKIVRTKKYGVHINWDPLGWFTDKELAGSEALVDIDVHAIDTVRYILGNPKSITVYAKVGMYYSDKDVDNTDIVMITWDNGVISVIESGCWQPHMYSRLSENSLFKN